MKRSLMRAARGMEPLDYAIENIRLVNVFTGEVYPAAIGIKEDTIVHVTSPEVIHLEAKQRLDGQGLYAIPGLIDTHLHIESSMLTPENYAEVVLPHGTTTIVTDPHEIGNVLGVEGVRYMVEASRKLDLRVLTLVPSCVPSAPAVETAGADFTPEVVEEMLSWEGIDGLAEVMNYPAVLEEDERMVGILQANERAGKLVQGHAPNVKGRDLSAYLLAGPNSDHESRTAAEGIEKLRAGMIVEIRESSFSLNMAELAKVVKDKGYVPNVTFCSDDVLASDLYRRGHINYVIRRAIEEGIDPIQAIRFATLNAAQRLKRDDLGAIAPGRKADIVLVDDLQKMIVREVFIGGKQIVHNGKLLHKQSVTKPPSSFMQTVKLPRFQASDFRLVIADQQATKARVRVIEYDAAPGIPTDFREVILPVHNGELQLMGYQGEKSPLCRVGVWNRHGQATHALGILAGFGITAGAVATTVAHDSHHLAVLGVDEQDMAVAANHLREMNGGMIGVHNGKVLASLSLPLAGLMSMESADRLGPQIEDFIHTLNQTIMPGFNPIHRLIMVTLPVIPRAKVTDLGLVQVEEQKLVPLVIETE